MKICHLIQYFIFIGICATLAVSLHGMSYQQQEKSPIEIDIALYNAIKKHDSKSIPDIIAQGADLEGTSSKYLCRNLTPLALAVLIEDITIIQLLIDGGADVDYKNGQEYTALDMASDKYALCLRELARAKFKPSFFTFCCHQTIINKLEEELNTLKVIVTFLNNCTTEPKSKERAEYILFLTPENLIEHHALNDSV